MVGDTVEVASGRLAGAHSADGSMHVFRGIPYAAPPIGELRWRPPRPPESWSGVRPAVAFAPVCMQTRPPEGSFYQQEFYPDAEPTSEDCLYLNVWTAATRRDEERPVMLWVHGGGFTEGSGSLPSFDGAALARRGVVVVTFNYRLGVFGLLAHPELTAEVPYHTSGNYGLLDHVAVLEWIRRNIAAFGGDPENVTMFGQSSGADDVNVLMASPLAAGLFHRAILQSGSAFAFGRKPRLEELEARGAAFADSVADGTIDSLRALSADSLLELAAGFGFSVGVDGRLLPDYVDRVFARGEQHDVPLLAGSTADEGTTLYGPRLTAERFRGLVERAYGDDAAAFLELYPARTDEQAKASFNASFRDEMAWGAQALAGLHVRTSGSPAFLYYFDHAPPGRRPERYGAFHSSELVYVFGTLDAVDRPWTSDDRALSDVMTFYWTRFAAAGDPNGSGKPAWPVFEPEAPVVLRFDADTAPGNVFEERVRRFLRKRWEGRTK